jgi:hypothetical protein
LVVLGDDRLLSLYPRLPTSLRSERRTPTIILLGQHRSSSIAAWEAEFENVWAIECEISSIPEAISSWNAFSIEGNSSERITPISQLLAANYVSFVWASAAIDLEQREFWVERLFSGLMEWNQRRRAGSLNLSGLDGVFQQVCCWQTGFPGRVSFTKRGVAYLPQDASFKKWFHENRSNPGALIVEVDDSGDPSSLLSDRDFDVPRSNFRTTWGPVDLAT